MDEDVKKFLRGAIIFVGVVVAFMWLFDLGPFEKSYEPEPVDVYRTNQGGQPTFTGGGHCEKCAEEGLFCKGWAGSSSHGGTCGRVVAAGKTCDHYWTAHDSGY